ncbi:hypothetical protein Tco_0803187 [Tanacetum coccineum]|uniref:Uncharacterized protein n=1 Tax=Tanacetum coccineum TaxID=301880 RepID=A0ABQ5A0W4_9ASTR
MKYLMLSMELELMAAELEARRMDQRQKDEALYLSTTDEELKEVLGARQSYGCLVHQIDGGGGGGGFEM